MKCSQIEIENDQIKSHLGNMMKYASKNLEFQQGQPDSRALDDQERPGSLFIPEAMTRWQIGEILCDTWGICC